MRRLIDLVGSTFDAGADATLVTCSSIGPAVDIAAQLHDKPVLRVDRDSTSRKDAMNQLFATIQKGQPWNFQLLCRSNRRDTYLDRKTKRQALRPIWLWSKEVLLWKEEEIWSQYASSL